MSQWKLYSLIQLCSCFLAFLLFFNICSFFLGSVAESIPFVPTSKGYQLTVTNLSLNNLPISVESFPLSSSTPFLTVKCGEDEEISEQQFSLSSEYFLSVFSLCDTITIDVHPKIPGVGLWLRCHNPNKGHFSSFIHFTFLFMIGVSLYYLFKNGKNNSVMRSTLITQTSILLILDPLKYLITYLPNPINFLHNIISSIGWWRATVEIFAEYGPLIRRKTHYYKIFTLIPMTTLLLTTFSEKLSRFYFPILSAILGISGGLVLPFSAAFFLLKARNVNGRNALFVHVISGTISMTICYFMKFLRVVNEEFKDSFLCESVETSFVGCYALFQAVFQAGETNEQKQPFFELKNHNFGKKIRDLNENNTTSGIREIDGMLDVIPEVGSPGNEAIFDFYQTTK